MMVIASPSKSLTSSLLLSVWREVAHTEYTKEFFIETVVDHTDLYHKDQNLDHQHHKDLVH